MNALKEIEAKAETTIAPKAAEALEIAKAVVIDDEETYRLVATWVTKELQPLRREIDETFDPGIKAQRAALDTMRASKNRYAKPYEEAVDIAKGKMEAWIERQNVLRHEAEERAREEARRRAEEERQKKAQSLARQGKPEEATKALAAPLKVAAVVPGSTVPKVDGIVPRKLWKYRIVDANLLPREYLKPDDERISRVVEALHEDAKIPGVEVYSETNIAAAAR